MSSTNLPLSAMTKRWGHGIEAEMIGRVRAMHVVYEVTIIFIRKSAMYFCHLPDGCS